MRDHIYFKIEDRILLDTHLRIRNQYHGLLGEQTGEQTGELSWDLIWPQVYGCTRFIAQDAAEEEINRGS